jgi:hypothetical protein
MNSKARLVITVVTLSFLMSFGIIFLKQRNDSVCDTIVEMKDGTVYECSGTMHYESGVTHVQGCDGTSFRVPTVDVKIIKSMKDE